MGKKEVMKEFEQMLHLGELKAYSKKSLERPLGDKEYRRMMQLKKEIGF